MPHTKFHKRDDVVRRAFALNGLVDLTAPRAAPAADLCGVFLFSGPLTRYTAESRLHLMLQARSTGLLFQEMVATLPSSQPGFGSSYCQPIHLCQWYARHGILAASALVAVKTTRSPHQACV